MLRFAQLLPSRWEAPLMRIVQQQPKLCHSVHPRLRGLRFGYCTPRLRCTATVYLKFITLQGIEPRVIVLEGRGY